MWGKDAELLKKYFLTEQEKDPSFIFEIDADDEWAYGCFGDVVVFDATLISMKSMPAKTPKMIITDQDPTMTKAVAQSLPNTFHRYCSWHILEKFSIYLNTITYRDFYKDFKYCIWESERPEEFERKWASIIKNENLHDNEWLKSIFELRSRWVPAYVNHVFSAGMSSSQRVESSHAFFKRYISKKNLLMDFILRFNKALAHQHHEDLNADHVDINEKPILKQPLEMEKQMTEIYTHKIFYTFQDDCKKFKSEGIPCRHILAFLRLFGDIPLPNQYIMKRWTRVTKSQMIYDKEG
nr:protein FAR-RED IMPAIRED RESPONSE 1-like [Ziziphus jujuba var. spinosa]